MKGAFDEFTISTDHNLLDMIYRFKFTISGIPETTLREILKNTLPPCDLKNAEQWSFDVIGTDIYEDIYQVTISFTVQRAGATLRQENLEWGIADTIKACNATTMAHQTLMRYLEEHPAW